MKNRAGVRGNLTGEVTAGHARHAWWQRPGRAHRLPQIDRGASPLCKKTKQEQNKSNYEHNSGALNIQQLELIPPNQFS